MAIKINLKDIPVAYTSSDSDKVLTCWGAEGIPKLTALSNLTVSSVGGTVLTCPDDGHSYRLAIVIVDGTPALSITKV